MSGRPLEVSVVMPCLNEADTLRTCIDKAYAALAAHDIPGEVVVADNGSAEGRAINRRVEIVIQGGNAAEREARKNQ